MDRSAVRRRSRCDHCSMVHLNHRRSPVASPDWGSCEAPPRSHRAPVRPGVVSRRSAFCGAWPSVAVGVAIKAGADRRRFPPKGGPATHRFGPYRGALRQQAAPPAATVRSTAQSAAGKHGGGRDGGHLNHASNGESTTAAAAAGQSAGASVSASVRLIPAAARVVSGGLVRTARFRLCTRLALDWSLLATALPPE